MHRNCADIKIEPRVGGSAPPVATPPVATTPVATPPADSIVEEEEEEEEEEQQQQQPTHLATLQQQGLSAHKSQSQKEQTYSP